MTDWYKPKDQGRFNIINVPPKQCELADFGSGKDAKANFDAWAGFSLICPDYTNFDGFLLEGEPASMISKNMQFVIQKCNPKNRIGQRPCKSDKEIMNYIRDFQVDSWAVE